MLSYFVLFPFTARNFSRKLGHAFVLWWDVTTAFGLFAVGRVVLFAYRELFCYWQSHQHICELTSRNRL